MVPTWRKSINNENEAFLIAIFKLTIVECGVVGPALRGTS